MTAALAAFESGLAVGETVSVDALVSACFNLEAEMEALSSTIRPYLRTSAGRAITAMVQDYGIGEGVTVETAFIRDLLQAQESRFARDVTATSIRGIRDQIAEGIAAGESHYQLRDRVLSYYQRQHGWRADIAAQYETGTAFESIRDALARQQGMTYKRWETMRDPRVEAICLHNEAAGTIPIGQVFPSGDQRPLAHPRCLPGNQRVLLPTPARAGAQRCYEGDIIVITTASGKKLSCTPNHPVLTPLGWNSAALLNEGGYVVSTHVGQWEAAPGDLHDDDIPPCIEEVTEALRIADGVVSVSVPLVPEDFHGDGKGSEVAVIWADGLLRNGSDASEQQEAGEIEFSLGVESGKRLASGGDMRAVLNALALAERGGMSRLGVAPVLGIAATLHHKTVGGGLASYPNASSDQALTNDPSVNPVTLRQRLLTGATGIESTQFVNGEGDSTFGTRSGMAANGQSFAAQDEVGRLVSDSNLIGQISDRTPITVFADQIVNIERGAWSGHVHNLQTESGWYVAEGIITHNCRCWLTYQMESPPSAE